MRRVGLALSLLLAGCRSAPAPAPADPHHLVPVDAAGLGAVVRAQPGGVVLVNVWATWCAPCVAEMSDLVRIGREYRPRGLSTLFVTVDGPEAHRAALDLLAGHGAAPPYYVRRGPDAAFIEGFGQAWSGALPATAIFDTDGALLAFWEGPVDYARLRDVLEVIEWP